MFGLDMNMIIFIGLAAMSAGAVGYAILFNTISNEKRGDQRLSSVTVGKGVKQAKAAARVDTAAKRKQREEALKTLDDQRTAVSTAKNPPLSVRLVQGGFKISPQKFWTISLIIGLSFAGLAYLMRAPIWMVPMIGFVVGFGGPQWWVNRVRKKRIDAFITEFPNAIDVICRGIKSGLPLGDCLRIISKDAQEPVRTEFRKVVEAQQMGLTTMDAIKRLAENVPTQEANFFAIVIAIQSQAGGNLAEALQNLSNTLRERKKMKDKIGALSMEAKASAYIIGALPIIVGLLVQISSPSYLVPLFTTETGQFNIMVGIGMMTIGTLIMKKMINFDF